MPMLSRRRFAALLAPLLAAGCAPVVGPGPFGEPMHGHAYVVRHMDKAAGDDPSLTPAGHARAVALADLMLADRPIMVFATPTRRARETAAPTAAWANLPVREYDAAAPDIVARHLSVRPGTVLVVGHSNTVPDLVERLGGTRPAPIDEASYGTVWRIDRATGRTETLSLRGAAAPAL